MCKVTFSFTLKGKLLKGMWKRGKDNGKGGGGFERVFENSCKAKDNGKAKVLMCPFISM